MTDFLMLAELLPTAADGQKSPFAMFAPMIIIFAIFYFMMIRPQQRKEKERRKVIDELKTGAKVVFGGGFIGTITNVKPDTFIVKIADKVKVEVLRGSVARVIEKGDKIGDEQ